MIAVLPFEGFYESVHSEAIDYAQEQMLQDSCGNAFEGLTRRADFSYTSDLLNGYSKLYTEQFAYRFGIAVTYESVRSPREYNFTTDRIFVEISDTEVARLLSLTKVADLDAVAKERHTSRDGFISFYRNDWRSWGAVSTWECEQLRTLLLAYLRSHGEIEEDRGSLDSQLIEDIDSNGELSSLCYDALSEKDRRLVKLADYLRTRSER